jgi:hypothetical protein
MSTSLPFSLPLPLPLFPPRVPLALSYPPRSRALSQTRTQHLHNSSRLSVAENLGVIIEEREDRVVDAVVYACFIRSLLTIARLFYETFLACLLSEVKNVLLTCC